MKNETEVVLETTKATIGKEKYKMIIESEGHAIIGDEPLSANGGDLGMNPFSLLISGLASCSVSTVKMYADRKNWPLDGAEVFVTMKQTMNEDGTKKIHLIKEVSIYGDLSQEQREKLRDIAAHCAVHRILTGDIEIDTTLRPEDVKLYNIN